MGVVIIVLLGSELIAFKADDMLTMRVPDASGGSPFVLPVVEDAFFN